MVTPRNRLSAYATFRSTLVQVNARVAVSIDQARQTLEKEIPDGQSLEETAKSTRVAWVEKRDRIKLVGATKEQKEISYGVLPYPPTLERMVQSMIQDYREVYRPGIDMIFVDYEVRAGLSSVYEQKGWVADDIHFESASRTLDCSSEYVAQVKPTLRSPCFFREHPLYDLQPCNWVHESEERERAWAGSDNGWTEGDKWTYTLDVVHDRSSAKVETRASLGFWMSISMVVSDRSSMVIVNASIVLQGIMIIRMRLCAASKSQTRIRQITESDYNAIVNGGLNVQNEDCGQMGAWYLFSALGFYPVNPVSVSIDLPSSSKKLEIVYPGASSKPYAYSAHDLEMWSCKYVGSAPFRATHRQSG
ncbi:hypothetical protein EV363DRAFT_1401802 [Boletus edulis]|nr:hypothetical protein EV363DRAFT_1401802 [Boletus edulis]